MTAQIRNRLWILAVCTAMFLGGNVSAQQEGRLVLNVPNYDLFTPTDWINAATFTLKESIPAGISGSIFTVRVMDVYLQGEVYKHVSGDPAPKLLASFYIKKAKPIQVKTPSGNEFVYTVSLGALSRGSELDVTYTENKTEVDKLKEQVKIALTGRFTLFLKLRKDDPETGTILDSFTNTWDIPFAFADDAKIQIQIEPVVTTPNPTISVSLPPERPTLEFELAVYRVQDNPRDAVQNGVPMWRERVKNGQTVHNYPPTATPLTTGTRYVIAGKSFFQSSASSNKLSVDADLVEFRYEDPASGTQGAPSSGTTTSTPGASATRPDPLVGIFGGSAPRIPSDLAQKLSIVLRELEDRGWTFSQFRYNNRTITAAELAQIVEQFANASVVVEE